MTSIMRDPNAPDPRAEFHKKQNAAGLAGMQQANAAGVASAFQALTGGGTPQPPAESFGSYTDPLTGKSVTANQKDIPAGTPFMQSAGLKAGPNGGTMTTGGDAANQFRGYVSAEGGGFGGYDASKDPNAGKLSAQAQWEKQLADTGMKQDANGTWNTPDRDTENRSRALADLAKQGIRDAAIGPDGNIYRGGMGGDLNAPGRLLGNINNRFGPPQSQSQDTTAPLRQVSAMEFQAFNQNPQTEQGVLSPRIQPTPNQMQETGVIRNRINQTPTQTAQTGAMQQAATGGDTLPPPPDDPNGVSPAAPANLSNQLQGFAAFTPPAQMSGGGQPASFGGGARPGITRPGMYGRQNPAMKLRSRYKPLGQMDQAGSGGTGAPVNPSVSVF